MQNCTILIFVSSELVDIFESITDFSLVLSWGKVSTGVTSLRAFTSLNIHEQCQLGPLSTLLLCCCQDQGLYFRPGLPFLGLCCGVACFQFYLDPSPSQHSSLLQNCQHCPEEAKSCRAWCPCRALSMPDSAPAGQYQLVSTQSVQGSPWLLPWPPDHRQLALAAPWQVLDWRNPVPPAVF